MAASRAGVRGRARGWAPGVFSVAGQVAWSPVLGWGWDSWCLGPVPGWAGGMSGVGAGVPGGDLWQGPSGIRGSCTTWGGEWVLLPHPGEAAEPRHCFGVGVRVWTLESLAGG